MKKILFILVCILGFYSCSTQVYTDSKTNKTIALQANGIKISHDPIGLYEGNTYEIVEITYNGNTHEFIKASPGQSFALAHWPDCKYCIKKDISGIK